MKRWLWLTALLCCVTASWAKAPTFTDPNKSIVVKPGERTITLTLQSNPTTGYSWFYQASKPHWIKVVKHRYVAPDSKLVGAPGYEEWTFNMPKLSNHVPRVAFIKLRYARPWDIKNSKPTTFAVVFTDA